MKIDKVTEPIIIYKPNKNKKYIIICGRRRFLASRMLGHKRIYAKIMDPYTGKISEPKLININEISDKPFLFKS